MPWLKVSDLFASHPNLMRLVGTRGSDGRTINEVTGFIARLGAGAAAHMTDYRVDYGTAVMYGQDRTELLLRQAVEVGLMTVEGRGKNRMWQIVEDEDLIHMRTKAEIEWERQQRRDLSDKRLTLNARRRDGDTCRYCGNPVDWKNRRGNRGGTYDHVNPGVAATPDTLVVCCKACNSSMGDTDAAERMERLLPVPEQPLYQDRTVELLAGHGIRVTQARPDQWTGNAATQARPGPWSGTAATARTSHPTAATARDEPTGESTAAPARAASTDAATAATRREGERSPQHTPARPPHGDPAATGAEFAHRQNDPPPAWADDPPPTDLQKPASSPRKQVYGPGRVGEGRAGPGARLPSPAMGPAQSLNPPSPRHRGKRGRRSKKE